LVGCICLCWRGCHEGIATRCKAEDPNRTPFMASPAGRAREDRQRWQERLVETDAFEPPAIVVEEAERPVFERVLDRAVNGHVRNIPACDIAGDKKSAFVAFDPVTLQSRCAGPNANAVMAAELPPTTVGPGACQQHAAFLRECRFFPGAVYLATPQARWLASTASSQRAYLVFEAVYSVPKVPDPVADVVDPVADLVRADPYASEAEITASSL
jgi:hypothetical protein